MKDETQSETNQLWDLASIGETMALIREDGQEESRSCFRLSYGGAESNVLSQASRLGLRTRWHGSVGEDLFGSIIVDGLSSQGISIELIPTKSRPTGFMVKTYRDHPDPEVEYFRSFSAATKISISDLDLEDVFNSRMVHMTGIFPAISEQAADTSERLFEEANKRGIPISFDLNYRSKLWTKSKASEFMKRIWPRSNYLFGDRAELSLLFDESPPSSDEELLSTLSANGKTVVLKKGSAGAAAMTHGQYFEVPAAQANVVDTVGAGDAFVGGYLSAAIRGHDTQQSLLVGAFCGASACESAGDWEGQPTIAQLQAKLGGEINWYKS